MSLSLEFVPDGILLRNMIYAADVLAPQILRYSHQRAPVRQSYLARLRANHGRYARLRSSSVSEGCAASKASLPSPTAALGLSGPLLITIVAVRLLRCDMGMLSNPNGCVPSTPRCPACLLARRASPTCLDWRANQPMDRGRRCSVHRCLFARWVGSSWMDAWMVCRRRVRCWRKNRNRDGDESEIYSGGEGFIPSCRRVLSTSDGRHGSSRM